ncbi:hypothetical protein ED312_02910 [Sinomicrobium pectinilyticum]|uniref:Uncharacterized protein n=1 Tax=Sinomicrobium pectinilyticum TaxID=1084421 RepID=A0A3N0EYN8_SINP1|nr:hypothetical protein ED312_02910 [Sinomicrobium pectinilyticum]
MRSGAESPAFFMRYHTDFSGTDGCRVPGARAGKKNRGDRGIKKGGVKLHLFAPNLTMNLTYLCYGDSNVCREILPVKLIR